MWLGWDIGGANIKVSDGESAISTAFPLWKSPERLMGILSDLAKQLPQASGFAVTMTGELADCFETKAEGVDVILSAVEEVAASRPVVVWQTGAEFVSLEVAREIPLLVAAANWHALATWVGRMVPEGLSLLLDIGSTTTDIIPLLNGVPIPAGLTDRERLATGELVYTGVRRTPVCAVSKTVPFRGENCPVAAELFANTLDVYLMLGLKEEDPNDLDTANGKPATRKAAHDRIAHMICCDRTEVTWDDALLIAEYVAGEQRRQIALALKLVLSHHSKTVSHVLISGSGSFLAETICEERPELRNAKRFLLKTLFEDSIAEAACAFAIARLAEERVPLGYRDDGP